MTCFTNGETFIWIPDGFKLCSKPARSTEGIILSNRFVEVSVLDDGRITHEFIR